MPLTFNVDGKTSQDPTLDDIAAGFGSITDVGAHDLSIVELERPPVTLCAFGNPKNGYSLDIREALKPKGTVTSKVTSPAKPIPQDEVTRAFQDFARGEDSWQRKFQWEPGINELPTGQAIRRLAVIAVSFVFLVLLLKFVLKLF